MIVRPTKTPTWEKTVKPLVLVAPIFLVLTAVLLADGPNDNIPDKVRPIPPAGIKVPDLEWAELHAGVAQLEAEIVDLRATLEKKPALLDLLPDVKIYFNSVRYALAYHQ